MFAKLAKQCIIKTSLITRGTIKTPLITRAIIKTPLYFCSTNNYKERAHEHVQEIINNEYPNAEKLFHPNESEFESPHSLRQVRSPLVPEDKFEDYTMPHGIWTHEQLECVEQLHKKPTRVADYCAYGTVLVLRSCWDLATGYLLGRRLKLFNFTSNMWLLRIVYLETAAGVPGMMFGMVRHLKSLRRMERDRGWIRCLLAEAENERIHLLTAMHLYQPSKPLRYAIIFTQGIMCNFLFFTYLISPRYGHSFVGYIEEQAVKTYTYLLQDIDDGKFPEFQLPASNLSRAYWRLSDDATWRDVFSNMRADEVNHRDVNHGLAELVYDPTASNPFKKLNKTYKEYKEKKKSVQGPF